MMSDRMLRPVDADVEAAGFEVGVVVTVVGGLGVSGVRAVLLGQSGRGQPQRQAGGESGGGGHGLHGGSPMRVEPAVIPWSPQGA